MRYEPQTWHYGLVAQNWLSLKIRVTMHRKSPIIVTVSNSTASRPWTWPAARAGCSGRIYELG